ncbi:MAG: hypothetical protein PHS32_00610 [Rhodoferax sp.]|uniref:hypothetical protein n=1 Tax=Rhodoferax sp. TaxID=50421 RepID=UPI00260A8ADE|nr:hypothetical protein [Rhodoferax sp.]MDD5332218.1 hypothetical protein [Rhodoferax sp.]
MKFVFALAVLFVAPVLALAQTSQPSTTVTKATEPAAPHKSPAKVRRSALKVVEEITPIDDDLSVTLTAEELEIAKHVYLGSIPCELGAAVTITASEKRPGFFLVRTKTSSFRMHPVASRTGAIRLEDPRAGAMWLQLGNKSMLMSQKLGQRLADNCTSPDQTVMAEMLKKNPAPSLLDAPAAAAK